MGFMMKWDYKQGSIQTPMVGYIKYSMNKSQNSKMSFHQDVTYPWQAPVHVHSNKPLRPQTQRPQYHPNNKHCNKNHWFVNIKLPGN